MSDLEKGAVPTPPDPQQQGETWRDPLVSRPIVGIMGIGFVVGMFVCMGLDAFLADFEGGTYILAFSAGAFLTLGYNVARFMRWGPRP